MHKPTYLLLLALAACTTGPVPLSTAPGSSASRATPDQAFTDAAAASLQFQIQSSRLAVQKARRPAVRAYASRMVEDHTAAQTRLAALAASKGITLATGPARPGTLDKLQAETSGFDAAYVAAQTEAHQAALATYQAEIANGRDPELKAFAQSILPQLQSHLVAVQRLRGGR